MSYLWNLPTKVLFGPDMLYALKKEKMPGKKAMLIISTGNSVKRNGSFEAVLSQLQDLGIETEIFAGVSANPTAEALDEGARRIREAGCDFLIGLGGGSVLDSATILSAVAPQTGCVWDYAFGGTGGRQPLVNKPLPYIAITTSAGTGSEVDCVGVVTNSATHEKLGVKGEFPVLAIVDPKLTITVPPDYTAYQGFDALFHSTEGYISRLCNEAAEMVELAAIRNIAAYLPRCVEDGTDLEARTKVSFANTMSGYSMELSSCTSEHAMEHAMSGLHENLPHGAGLIMISLAYYTRWIRAHVCDDRFIDMAKAMGKADASDPMDFVDALRTLEEKCGVENLRMSDYGITEEELPLLADIAMTALGGMFRCDRLVMTREDVIGIFRDSYR